MFSFTANALTLDKIKAALTAYCIGCSENPNEIPIYSGEGYNTTSRYSGNWGGYDAGTPIGFKTACLCNTCTGYRYVKDSRLCKKCPTGTIALNDRLSCEPIPCKYGYYAVLKPTVTCGYGSYRKTIYSCK